MFISSRNPLRYTFDGLQSQPHTAYLQPIAALKWATPEGIGALAQASFYSMHLSIGYITKEKE